MPTDKTLGFTLVSFADERMKPTLSRLGRQATAFDAINRQIFYTENDLSSNFKRQTGSLLKRGVRGFGYWVWKSEVILMALDQIDFGELLCYCDAGMHLNIGGASHLERYLGPLVRDETDLVAFTHDASIADYQLQAADVPDLSEYKYTKGDMLDFWGVRQDFSVTHTPQYMAGLLLMRKTRENVDRLKRWKEVALDIPHLFDDSPSIELNFPGFIENRHDQSYFSLMCKSTEHHAFSAFECWHASMGGLNSNGGAISNYPFHARRDKKFGGHRRFSQPLFSIYLCTKRLLIS